MFTEETLMQYLKENYYPDLRKTKGQYTNFDCVSEKDKLIIELKCRKTHYDELIVEKYKYDIIMEVCDNYNYTPSYIFSTPKGIYFFELKGDLNWFSKKVPSTTEFENKRTIDKIVGLLHIRNAKIL